MFQHLLSILQADGDSPHSRRAQTMGHEPCATHSGRCTGTDGPTVPVSAFVRKHNSQGQFRGSVLTKDAPRAHGLWACLPLYSRNLSSLCLSSKPYLKVTDRGVMVCRGKPLLSQIKEDREGMIPFSPISDFMEPCMSVCSSPSPDGEHLQGRQHVLFTLLSFPSTPSEKPGNTWWLSINVHCLLH